MKRTSLKDILISLKEERHAVELPEELRRGEPRLGKDDIPLTS